jgi:hypothetical protein
MGINLLTEVKKRMRKLGIPFQYAELSKRWNKKIKVVIDGKTIHFGEKYSTSYLEGAPEHVRDAYRARHSKIFLKDGRQAVNVKYTPAYLSYWILWA